MSSETCHEFWIANNFAFLSDHDAAYLHHFYGASDIKKWRFLRSWFNFIVRKNSLFDFLFAAANLMASNGTPANSQNGSAFLPLTSVDRTIFAADTALAEVPVSNVTAFDCRPDEENLSPRSYTKLKDLALKRDCGSETPLGLADSREQCAARAYNQPSCNYQSP